LSFKGTDEGEGEGEGGMCGEGMSCAGEGGGGDPPSPVSVSATSSLPPPLPLPLPAASFSRSPASPPSPPSPPSPTLSPVPVVEDEGVGVVRVMPRLRRAEGGEVEGEVNGDVVGERSVEDRSLCVVAVIDKSLVCVPPSDCLLPAFLNPKPIRFLLRATGCAFPACGIII